MPANGIHSISVAFFDLDGTLRFNRPDYTGAFYDYAASLGAPDDPERRRRAFRWTHFYWAQSSELHQDRCGFPHDADFWYNYAVRALLALGCELELAQSLAPEVFRYMSEEHQSQSWVPPQVFEMLAVLQKAGVRLGLLSNRDKPCDDELARLGLRDYFDLRLMAYEVGAWKPDPLIFQQALKRMGVQPQQAAYVGDNYYADVVGAQRAGITPVLYDPAEVFPDVDCAVVRTFDEIPVLLGAVS